jgi:diguanylate cyclase
MPRDGPPITQRTCGLVIGMPQNLKLRIIAEGAETLEQLEFLRAHHRDEAQRYFSRPVSAEWFARLLRLAYQTTWRP